MRGEVSPGAAASESCDSTDCTEGRSVATFHTPAKLRSSVPSLREETVALAVSDWTRAASLTIAIVL